MEHLRSKTYFYSSKKLDSSVPFLSTNVLNSADYKELILPKVLMVLNGFTVLLHPVSLTLDHGVFDLQFKRHFLRIISYCHHILE